MTITDPEQERKRLAEAYGRMSEGELSQAAEDASQLSELAVEILQSEIERRGLDIELNASPADADVAEFQELLTIGQFRDLPEALLAKGSLESAGIECYLSDVNMVRMNWSLSNGLGGIRLRARPEDADAALEVLEQGIPKTIEVEGVGEYELPRCPKCGSLDSGFDNFFERVAAFSLFAMNLPLPFSRSQRRCHSCSHEWYVPGNE